MEKFKVGEYVKHKIDNRRGRVEGSYFDYYLVINKNTRWLFKHDEIELDLETKKLELL